MQNNLPIKIEFANALTHGIGILIGIACIPLLISLSVQSRNILYIAATMLYGFSFLMVFTSSTLYHAVAHTETKKLLRKLDHISIFFLIAGTYTPFVLIYGFDDLAGKILLLSQWVLVIMGILIKTFLAQKSRWPSVIIYLTMGWSIVFLPDSFLFKMPDNVIWLIAYGGAFYTLGVIFYLWKKPMYHHAIWHIFVLLASLFHLSAVAISIA